MFGTPPFQFLANHLVQDSDFQEDAQFILGLDEEVFLQISTQLANTDDFLNRSSLAAIIDSTLNENTERITSIISRFSSILHDADMDVMDAMDALGKSIEEKVENLTPEDRQKLTFRIQKLVAEPNGFAKQYKARQLVDAIGAELEDARVICDIRPIFDRERQRIEGAIPIAILRLDYSKPDGESAVVEVRITEKQIKKISEDFTTASLKLKMIKELLIDQELPIPKTKSTFTED